MRVLHVTHTLGNGGAERQMALLAMSLPVSHPVTMFSLAGGPFVDVLREHGIRVELFERSHRLDTVPAARMWRAAADIGPEVVHTWGWMGSLSMIPFCRRLSIPLIDGSIRQGRLPSRRRAASRLGVALADQVVANSRAGLAAFGVPEHKGRVIYNGFDASRLVGLPRDREVKDPSERTTVVMTGRMMPEKDWPMLFRAARRLSELDKDRWRFVAVGDGTDRTRLMHEAADLISEGALEFLSAGSEVLPIVASADIGVLLTNHAIAAEGCSNSIMEYMACQLPVVCTDSGGNRELVLQDETGYLIPPSDDAALVSRLRCLRSDPIRARSMGEAGASRLLSSFTVDEMVSGYLSVYDWACGR